MAERMVGKQAPRFEMKAVLPNGDFGMVSLEENIKNNKWTVLFFYPLDFTFVCSTEITAISERYEEFEDLDAVVIGASTDSVYSHKAWINMSRTENGLGKIKYSLAADTNHQVSRDYGVLIEEEGVALCGLFVIDPEGELKYAVAHHNDIGRNVDEVLRVLQALQTGQLCPANPRQKTLEV
ncbi:redoxin family protein [Anoxybacillus sp. B7M1]|jgi:peroxiredoxin 2/4|uniref:Peroxiredoxin n=1 Tax=Anoxybacteroides rupiense TaxID=311460 RepID=A0ABD5IQT7_9BACL|nr:MULTISPECIES: peroxiredoxin [Anoxybacillus]ANB57789.1 redoxin family protein [Anoxybacillus sp. B2M1]ANB65294.1 redoxin family protein [Anoxybacillus sp. B7M1]KXG10385.1 putative peroxiredoxin [Anoxybacillus sp. P3H1B]MBS2770686.1 peroxiredoxin [Anoxybacillus rupiensis]MDE8565676.1 peroxiredoxin [Anoxybacillus rupiensis]